MERIDDWLNVPDSYVNDDGQPNLDNSDVQNDNDGRVSVRCEKTIIKLSFSANRQSVGGLLSVLLGFSVHWFH